MRFRLLKNLTKITRDQVIFITDFESTCILKYGDLPYLKSVNGMAFFFIFKCDLNLQKDTIAIPVKSGGCLSVEVKDDPANKYCRLLSIGFLDSLDDYRIAEIPMSAGIQYKLPTGNIMVYISFSRYSGNLFDMNVSFFQVGCDKNIAVTQHTTDHFDTDDVFMVDENKKEVYRFTGLDFKKLNMSENIYLALNYDKLFSEPDKYDSNPTLVVCVDDDRQGDMINLMCPLIVGKTYIRKSVHQDSDGEWYADIYDVDDPTCRVGIFKNDRFKLCYDE